MYLFFDFFTIRLIVATAGVAAPSAGQKMKFRFKSSHFDPQSHSDVFYTVYDPAPPMSAGMIVVSWTLNCPAVKALLLICINTFLYLSS